MTYLDQLPDIVDFIFTITVVLPLKEILFLFHTTLLVYGYMKETITVVLHPRKKRNTHMCTITVVFYNHENLVSFSYYTVGVHIYETHYYSYFYIQEKHLMHTYVYMNIIFYFQYIIIIS